MRLDFISLTARFYNRLKRRSKKQGWKWSKLQFQVKTTCFFIQNSAATFTASNIFRGVMRRSVTSADFFKPKRANVWQAGGVHFPQCILSSYRISSSHTIPFTGEECVKGTTGLCRWALRCWKVSFMSLSLQRALRPEIAANLSFISWLKLFRPEGIDMQTRWFSFRSAEQTFIQNKKNKTPCSFLIHFTVADTMAPPVNGPFERLAPLTVHRIQKHMD